MAAGRQYHKGNPEIDILESVVTKSNVATFNNEESVSAPNTRYTKPEAIKIPNVLFVIYSGGTEREKDYFRLIDKNTVVNDGLERLRREKERRRIERKKKIWLFTADNTHQHKAAREASYPERAIWLAL